MINHITLYGTGLIGCGWATHLIRCGIPNITLYDLEYAQLEKARERISHDLSFLVEEGILTVSQKDERLSNLHFTTDRAEALHNADLVIENCPENVALKQSVMADIEAHCRSNTIISSSTSGISTTLIAEKMDHPDRLIGAHPYHPVYLLPLVELSAGKKTAPEYLQQLKDFFVAIHKEPVIVKKESPGYIGTRLMSVLFRESTHMINSGIATMEDIDRAFTYGPGMRYGLMGINMTLQLAGGENGLQGALFSGMGTAGGNPLESYANFTQWPDSYLPFWQTCQNQMDQEMAHQDNLHGHTNQEIEYFRDRGLVLLLRHHGKL